MRRGPPGPPPVRPRCAPAPRVAVRGWCAARIVAACAGLVAVEKCARLTTAAWGAERTLGARARVMVAVRWMGAADGEWSALLVLRTADGECSLPRVVGVAEGECGHPPTGRPNPRTPGCPLFAR